LLHKLAASIYGSARTGRAPSVSNNIDAADCAASVEFIADYLACYGERKTIVEAEDWEVPGFQACKDAASV
jgi:hypothetical protein